MSPNRDNVVGLAVAETERRQVPYVGDEAGAVLSSIPPRRWCLVVVHDDGDRGRLILSAAARSAAGVVVACGDVQAQSAEIRHDQMLVFILAEPPHVSHEYTKFRKSTFGRAVGSHDMRDPRMRH